jgi:2-oxoglutarate ferredoxin oxidoreductase subunit delta
MASVWVAFLSGIQLENESVKGTDMNLWRKPFDQAEKTTKPGKVLINEERCKGCGYCVEFCPRLVLKMSNELGPRGYYLAKVEDESKCLSCGLCEVLCPEFAIQIPSGENES